MGNMPASWNDLAQGWDDNAVVNLFADLAFATLVTEIDICNPIWNTKRVLDFGCGTGLLAEKVAPHVHELIAVDTSEKMIAVLEGKDIPNVITVHGDILDDSLPFERVSLTDFDLIYVASVFSFLPDYEDAIMALTRLLKRGGHLIQWDWERSDQKVVGLSKSQISAALNKAQLSQIRIEPAFTVEVEEQKLAVLIGVGTR